MIILIRQPYIHLADFYRELRFVFGLWRGLEVLGRASDEVLYFVGGRVIEGAEEGEGGVGGGEEVRAVGLNRVGGGECESEEFGSCEGAEAK